MGLGNFTEQVRRARDLRRARRADGLCRCGQEAREGKAMCAECAKQHSAGVSASIAKNKQEGLCACGREREPGKGSCSRCLARRRENTKALVARGLCISCASRTPPQGGTVCETCRAKNRPKQIAIARRYRELVLSHYGRECKCCGEDTAEFLTVDHVNGDGAKHRKAIKATIYRWLVKNNYPAGFQILCWNCNLAKQLHGECPHNRVRLLSLVI